MAAAEAFEEGDIQELLMKITSEHGYAKPKFEISIATKPGDNYSGRILRVITREDGKEPLSLIFKTAPVSQVRRDAFATGIIFSNEASMYNVILPAFNAILREHGISKGEWYPCTPRCLRTRVDADWKENALDVLVLEDMTVKGYNTVERSVGLDADQCRAILSQLALLHSASFALRNLQPEETRQMESILKQQDPQTMMEMLQALLWMMRSNMYLVEDRYPAGSAEHDKLTNFMDTFVDRAKSMFCDKEIGNFKCVTHGDCWSNNVLFKYKDGKIENICLIDFQLSLVASPVTDILCVLIASTTKKTRDEHFHSLVRGYWEELSSHLKTMGCDPESIYPWSTLQDQLKKHGAFSLFRALVSIPLIFADTSEIPENFDTMMESSGSKDFTDVFNSVKNVRRMDECKERMSDVLADCIAFEYI